MILKRHHRKENGDMSEDCEEEMSQINLNDSEDEESSTNTVKATTIVHRKQLTPKSPRSLPPRGVQRSYGQGGVLRPNVSYHGRHWLKSKWVVLIFSGNMFFFIMVLVLLVSLHLERYSDWNAHVDWKAISMKSIGGIAPRVAYLDGNSTPAAGKEGRHVEAMAEPKDYIVLQSQLKNAHLTSKNNSKPLVECVPLHPWHNDNHPTCNTIHETHIEYTSVIGKGSSRVARRVDTYMGPGAVLSMYKWEHYEGIHYWKDARYLIFKARKEAAVMDHLSSVNCVMNTFSYCGMSMMNELANGITLREKIGLIEDYNMKFAIADTFSDDEKLAYSKYLASCLAQIHGIDGNKRRDISIVHSDFHAGNIWFVNGLPKVGDFGNTQLIELNNTSKEICKLAWKPTIGKMRVPEDAKGTYDERRDLYLFGSMLYSILNNGRRPYDAISGQEMVEKTLEGIAPTFAATYNNSSDQAIQALVNAIRRLMMANEDKRPHAWQVAKELDKAMPWKSDNEVADTILGAGKPLYPLHGRLDVEDIRFATLLGDSSFFPGVVALLESLRSSPTAKKPIVGMVDKAVDSSHEAMLTSLGADVVHLHISDEFQQAVDARNISKRWQVYIPKLLMLQPNVTRSDIVFYIDADAIIRGNVLQCMNKKIISKFRQNKDLDFVASGNRKYFNAGVMLLRPSDRMFNYMFGMLRNGTCRNVHECPSTQMKHWVHTDQDIFIEYAERFWERFETLHMKSPFNLRPMHAIYDRDEDCSIVHYAGLPKPWEAWLREDVSKVENMLPLSTAEDLPGHILDLKNKSKEWALTEWSLKAWRDVWNNALMDLKEL